MEVPGAALAGRRPTPPASTATPPPPRARATCRGASRARPSTRSCPRGATRRWRRCGPLPLARSAPRAHKRVRSHATANAVHCHRRGATPRRPRFDLRCSGCGGTRRLPTNSLSAGPPTRAPRRRRRRRHACLAHSAVRRSCSPHTAPPRQGDRPPASTAASVGAPTGPVDNWPWYPLRGAGYVAMLVATAVVVRGHPFRRALGGAPCQFEASVGAQLQPPDAVTFCEMHLSLKSPSRPPRCHGAPPRRRLPRAGVHRGRDHGCVQCARGVRRPV